MKIDKQAASDHIRSVLLRHDLVTEFGKRTTALTPEEDAELETLYNAAMLRLCPKQSVYTLQAIRGARGTSNLLDLYKGILKALLADYENDRMQVYEQFIRQGMFADFLEMARYLIENEHLKDPAAVLAGSVLEQHLRSLCVASSIGPLPMKLDLMNAELVKKNVYNKTVQKAVTYWAGLRNNAAHGQYDQYKSQDVELMIDSIRNFIATYPA